MICIYESINIIYTNMKKKAVGVNKLGFLGLLGLCTNNPKLFDLCGKKLVINIRL